MDTQNHARESRQAASERGSLGEHGESPMYVKQGVCFTLLNSTFRAGNDWLVLS